MTGANLNSVSKRKGIPNMTGPKHFSPTYVGVPLPPNSGGPSNLCPSSIQPIHPQALLFLLTTSLSSLSTCCVHATTGAGHRGSTQITQLPDCSACSQLCPTQGPFYTLHNTQIWYVSSCVTFCSISRCRLDQFQIPYILSTYYVSHAIGGAVLEIWIHLTTFTHLVGGEAQIWTQVWPCGSLFQALSPCPGAGPVPSDWPLHFQSNCLPGPWRCRQPFPWPFSLPLCRVLCWTGSPACGPGRQGLFLPGASPPWHIPHLGLHTSLDRSIPCYPISKSSTMPSDRKH